MARDDVIEVEGRYWNHTECHVQINWKMAKSSPLFLAKCV